MAGQRGNYSLMSEFCRDAEVLIFIFSPLDIWFKALDGTLKLNSRDTITAVLGVFLLTAIFQVGGLFSEKWGAEQ
jgi:hypothetical protein